MISICFTYYRSLTLENFAAALYSVRQQKCTQIGELIIVDNNTDDAVADFQQIIDDLKFTVPVHLLSFKHGDCNKTHTWSTNTAVRHARFSTIFFTRADYLLEFDAVEQLSRALTSPRQFVVGGYYDVNVPIGVCESVGWRAHGPSVLQAYGQQFGHVLVDSGVWCTTRETFELVNGLDENLTSWGHAQTVFQHNLYRAGVEFVQVPAIIFYHPAHGYEVPRDHSVAQQQLQAAGLNLRDMWARYTGPDKPSY